MVVLSDVGDKTSFLINNLITNISLNRSNIFINEFSVSDLFSKKKNFTLSGEDEGYNPSFKIKSALVHQNGTQIDFYR